MTIRYRFKGKIVKAPRGRSVQAELWSKGVKKETLGTVKNKKQADTILKMAQLRGEWKVMKNYSPKTKDRWDVAAVDLAKRAIKDGLKKGDNYQLWLGSHHVSVFDTHGGSGLRSLKSRKVSSKSLSEEILREMFRLAKLQLHSGRIGSNAFKTLKLDKFKLRKVTKGQGKEIAAKQAPKAKVQRKGGSSKKQAARAKKQKLQRSTRKITPKAKRSYAVLRGGAKRKGQSRKPRSTAKSGGKHLRKGSSKRKSR